MTRHRLLAATMLLVCACGAARAADDGVHAELLRGLEQLGAQLESGQAHRDWPAWQQTGEDLRHSMAGLPLVRGARISLPAAFPDRNLLDRLDAWCSPRGPGPPTAEEYGHWLRQIRRTLGSAQRLGAAPPGYRELVDARVKLEEVLAQRAYTDIIDRRPSLSDRIEELITRYVLGPVFGRRSGVARRIVIVVSLVLLALLIAHMTWETWRMFRHGQTAGPRRRARGPVGPVLLLAGREELLARGDRLRGQGRLQEAIGLYYLALISSLARAGCTELDRTLTNWEHYQRARNSGRLTAGRVERLAQGNIFFDDHRYGGRTPSDPAVGQFRSLVAEFSDAG